MTRRDALKTVGTAIILNVVRPVITSAAPQTSPARLPLYEFVQDAALVKAFRKGVKEMKKRKPSDPLSWFYQAAIHGVTIEAIQYAARDDANLINVDQHKYWNQCPHNGQASANFLPWHRGY